MYTLSGLALAACDKSCDKDTLTGTSPTPPIIAPSPIGYSNVATLNASDVNMIAGLGLTLVQAEMIPFRPDGGDTNIDKHFGRISEAVAAARRAGIIFFLTLVNWNGASQRAQSDSWFYSMVDRVAGQLGPGNIWLEGVSEPDTNDAKARRWIEYALSRWPGTKVINGHGGRGNYPGGDILDWHYCDYPSFLSGVKTTDRLHSTDCTPILASNLSEAQVREITREAINHRRKLILYDTFNAPGTNANVVRWMGEALKEEK